MAAKAVDQCSGGREGGFGLYAITVFVVAVVLIVSFFFPRFLKMRSGIYAISCREIRRKIETAVGNYDTIHTMAMSRPGETIDLDKLKAKEFLAEVQYCPEGGRYFFGPAGEILCSIHFPGPASQTEEVATSTEITPDELLDKY